MTNPSLDQHFRRAHALRTEAAQHLTPEVRTLVEAHISIQDRARGIGPMDALFFEKWRTVATGQAKLLLDQANDCYWRVVLQMDGYCRKKADIHHRRLMYDFEDLYQAARMGCWRAAVRFDPDRGYKFVSFADDWVRVSCDRCRNQDHDLNIGNNQASTGNWSKGVAIRLDAPILGLDEVRVIERVAAEEVEAPDTMALARLREVMDELELSDVERVCLENLGEDGPTLAEIGKRFGRSRERMRQIRNEAFAKIKAAMLAETQETQKTKEDEMPKVRWPYYRKNPIIPGVCLVEGCDQEKDLVRGVCKTHHATLSRYGRLEEFALPPQTHIPRVLEIDDRGSDICLIKGCNNLPYGQGYCRKHYHHLRAKNALSAPNASSAPSRKETKFTALIPPPVAIIDPPPPPPPPPAPIQLTREDLWRRYELVNRADSIRGLADARAPLVFGGIEIPLTPALERALREHADALEAEALRGAA